MTQPDNFGFGEEAALLKESARKFFADNFPTDKLHRMVASDHNPERMSACAWDRDLWQQMVDLGWTSLAVPESAGGLGMPVVAVAGLVEELGRAAFPCPLLATLNATYVLAACGSGGEAALAEIAEGVTASLAITNRQGSWSAADTDVQLCTGQVEWHRLVCAGRAQGRPPAGQCADQRGAGACTGWRRMPRASPLCPMPSWT